VLEREKGDCRRGMCAAFGALSRLPWVALFFAINAAAYFLLIHFSTNSISFYISSIDGVIPFEPGFVWIYLSLFPVMIYSLLWGTCDRERFLLLIISYSLFVLASSLFYIFLPSIYPCPHIPNVSDISTMLVAWIHSFDKGNTFPSGHTAFSFMTLLVIWRYGNALKRLCFCVWFILILASTLVLKQHNVLDLVSGIAVGSICFMLAKRFAAVLNEKLDGAKDFNKGVI